MLICRFVSATRDTIVMTKKMAEAGADVALVVTPCYFKSLMNNQALEQHYTKVNEIEHPIATVRQRSCGKLMFPVVSVCQSFCLFTGGPQIGPRLNPPALTIQGPLSPTCSSNVYNLDLNIQGPCPLGAAGKRAVGLRLKTFLLENNVAHLSFVIYVTNYCHFYFCFF